MNCTNNITIEKLMAIKREVFVIRPFKRDVTYVIGQKLLGGGKAFCRQQSVGIAPDKQDGQIRCAEVLGHGSSPQGHACGRCSVHSDGFQAGHTAH